MLRWLAVPLLVLWLPLPVAAEQVRPGWSHSGPTPSGRSIVSPARPGVSNAGPVHARSSVESSVAINVNTADTATLVALKGVGEKKARAIVAFRKAHGPFATLDDFEEVPGIGPALIEANRDRIRFR